MSDNQGNRPEENVPAAPPHPGPVPPQAAPQAPAGWTAPTAQNPQGPYARPPQAYGAPQPSYAGRPAPQSTQPTTPLSPEAPEEPRKKSGAGKVVGLIVAAALVGGAAGLGGGYAGAALWGGESEPAPVAGRESITINDPDDATLTTAIAAKVVPSVVTISATSGEGGGTGSGVILDDEGHVVTNTHVVTLDGQSADPVITATTSDGRVYDAEIVGVDPIYDLAVIQLQDAEDLTPIEFADSDKLNVGDVAVAVGAPLGLSNTVTTGIISALERSISVASAAVPDDAESEDGGQPAPGQEGPFFFDFGQGGQQPGSNETISIAVIQTDAAINPGNSGGALVDSEGRLIGINVAIASAGGASGQAGNIGVGFAIPSDIAERVADEIIETGSATHGLLGATVQPASAVEGTEIAGAYIAEVTPGGAADEAGLQEGDIVTAVDGKPITTSIDLTAQVRALAAGADATLTYVRDGETRTADVTLGELGA